MMRVLRGFQLTRRFANGCVATIGSFDGLHVGHQALVKKTVDHARTLGCPAVVISFDPSPQVYFSRGNALCRLMPLRDKYDCLASMGVDCFVILPFGKRLSAMTAAQFMAEILIDGLNVQTLFVGDDFRFGRERTGCFTTLQAGLGAQGRRVDVIPTVNDVHGRISSSRLRHALLAHQMTDVQALLGRPYHLSGRVVYGDQRGQALGFPTANIHMKQQLLPLAGIYLVAVHGVLPKAICGVASIGKRPMYPAGGDVLEVYLLDVDQTLYGQYLKVDFLTFLRGEQYFPSETALCDQMHADVDQARALWQRHFVV